MHLTNAAMAKTAVAGNNASGAARVKDDLEAGRGRMAWTMAAFLDHVTQVEPS